MPERKPTSKITTVIEKGDKDPEPAIEPKKKKTLMSSLDREDKTL
jgi:hypothetical protein